jgi:uncharacterized protein YutE (UPF0331/DUF86 family)
VVLKPEAIRSRLLKLEEVVSRLEELRSLTTEDLKRSYRDAWAVERGLQLGAETVLDIGNHILSAHFGVSAEDHEEVVQLLARHGVLSPDLRHRLAGLGGFRNILVHDYLRLDLELVADALKRAPADLSDFAAEVRDWLGTLEA